MLKRLWDDSSETFDVWLQGKEQTAVARDDDRNIVGSISWYYALLTRFSFFPHHCTRVDDYIMNLLVLESHRNRGIGAALTTFAVQDCIEKFPVISIETSNPAASRLYCKLGFRVAASYHIWTPDK